MLFYAFKVVKWLEFYDFLSSIIVSLVLLRQRCEMATSQHCALVCATQSAKRVVN